VDAGDAANLSASGPRLDFLQSRVACQTCLFDETPYEEIIDRPLTQCHVGEWG